MSVTNYTISEAARIIGKNRTTVDRHLKAGKVSFELNAEGVKVIEASELARAYNLKPEDLEQTVSQPEQKFSRANLEAAKAQEKLIAQYEDRIARLEQHLEKALDITPLLENRHSETNQWNKLQQQIAKLEAQHQEEMKKWKHRYLREARKSWWDKLFEGKRVGDGR